MIRLTTPTHRFTLPYGSDDIEELLVTYKQGTEIVLEKTKEDVTFDGNTVTYKLTQEETKAFEAGRDVRIQVRILTAQGNAFASEIIAMKVADVLNDEVLGDED